MSKLREQITSHYDIQRRYSKVSILLSALASTRTQSTKQKIHYVVTTTIEIAAALASTILDVHSLSIQR